MDVSFGQRMNRDIERISIKAKIVALMGVMVDLGRQIEELKQKAKEIEETQNEKL